MNSAFEERTRNCQRALAATGSDGCILSPGANMFYLTGFMEEPGERPLFLFVPEDGDPVFVVPAMYHDQLADTRVEDVLTWTDEDDPWALVDTVLSDRGMADHVLVDDRMWALFTQELQRLRPNTAFGLASDVLGPLRMQKDERELETLQRAGALADNVSEAIRGLGADAIGMTERELAAEIETQLEAGGADGIAFDTIVGAGENGAMPHHRYSDRAIERGDPVVLDFGPTVDQYPGDQTRTVVFDGTPPEPFEEVHSVVLEAQEAAVDAVEPGVPAERIDRVARDVIESAGFGDQFVHRTGHGVGLSVHEDPYIVEGNQTTLEPGMVFSVEPGVYVKGEFGVRIEDLVAVTEDGCERLNDSPRTWHSL